MERNFYNDDFEHLIKQKADQYKMYPSERVWKGVYGSLHSRKRWYWLGLGFVLLLSGVSYYAIEELVSPSPAAVITKAEQPLAQEKKKDEDNKLNVPFFPSTFKSGSKTNLPVESVATTANNEQEPVELVNLIVEETDARQPQARLWETLKGNQELIFSSVLAQENASLADGLIAKNEVASKLESKPMIIVTPRLEDEEAAKDAKRINWLQEYAVYDLTPPKLKRLSWQLSFSPTVNYRKMVGNKQNGIGADAKNIPIAIDIEGEPDNLLNHTPAIGFEMGSSALYAVNKLITFKAGLQFNYSRYNIEAYSSNSTDRATIALNNFYGYSVDSITTYTRFRNFGGNEIEALHNQYFQFSVPIGMEIRLLGNKKLQLHVAGTVQPTYLLNRDSYLITTDYKNYTREPQLIRKWNVNAGAEAFVSYRTGMVRWQVGPQFRYQVFSSYVKEYPIKEYLKEYGLKLAVSTTIR
jgi:hypothetical protein